MPPRDRIAEPFTFFVDRSCGKHSFPDALRSACLNGETVEVHDELFAQDDPDEKWLTYVGERRLVAFTQDDRIRFRTTELEALVQAKSAVFILTSAHLNNERMKVVAAQCLPRVRTAVRRFAVALVATVNADGHVKVIFAGSEKLSTPVTITKK